MPSDDLLRRRLEEIINFLSAKIDINNISTDALYALVLFYDFLCTVYTDRKYRADFKKIIRQLEKRLNATDSSETSVDWSTLLQSAIAINIGIKHHIVNYKADLYFRDIENLLYVRSLRCLMERNSEVVEGGLGGVLFALGRLPSLRAIGYLQQVVGVIDQQGIYQDYFGRHQSATSDKNNYLHLGLPKGVSGLVTMLTRISRNGYFEKEIDKILGAAVPDLIAALTLRPEISLKWSDGILGVAVAIGGAGKRQLNGTWENAARTIRETALQIPINPMTDHSFYQGSAGISFLFEKLYEETGDMDCKLASAKFVDMMYQSTGLFFATDQPSGNSAADAKIISEFCMTGTAFMKHLFNRKPIWEELVL
jgi:hypothetical protein